MEKKLYILILLFCLCISSFGQGIITRPKPNAQQTTQSRPTTNKKPNHSDYVVESIVEVDSNEIYLSDTIPMPKLNFSDGMDISKLCKYFIDCYETKLVPWYKFSYLKPYQDDKLTYYKSPVGDYLMSYDVPLAIKGIPIIKNNLGSGEKWYLLLLGSKKGANLLSISFKNSTKPNYDFDSLAWTIMRHLSATLENSYHLEKNTNFRVYNVSKELSIVCYSTYWENEFCYEIIIGSKSDIKSIFKL